jgi:hypothetical protein
MSSLWLLHHFFREVSVCASHPLGHVHRMMSEVDIATFYSEQTVFLTGATGFMGKVSRGEARVVAERERGRTRCAPEDCALRSGFWGLDSFTDWLVHPLAFLSFFPPRRPVFCFGARCHCLISLTHTVLSRDFFPCLSVCRALQAVLEKLLRSCPNLKGIFVLVRRKAKESPEDRMNALLDSEVGVQAVVGGLCACDRKQ